ncbi:MAG: type II secretion system protein [Clostridia bacterium]
MKENTTKNQKGITLIALVVTIVILLILAGISINAVIGENGLISKARDAKAKTEQDAVNTEIALNNLYDEMMGILDVNGGSGGATTVDGVTIPVGFYYVGGTKTSGLVISDNSADANKYQGQTTVGKDLVGNQFVWIPVETYANFHLIEGYYDGTLVTWVTDGDVKEAGASATAGTPLANNSTAGTAESIAMYKSVEDNKGFYIARYEAGISNVDEDGNPVDNYSLETKVVATGAVKPLSKADLGVWNYIPWGGTYEDTASDGMQGDDTKDGAVKVARSMYTKSSTCGVTSTLCYGVQWDAIMNFIDSNYLTGECADDSFVKDSTDQGNYTGTLSTTGYYAVKNIYDLAGNVEEWTMEAYDADCRVSRGRYLQRCRFYLSSLYTYQLRSRQHQRQHWFPCSFIFVVLNARA